VTPYAPSGPQRLFVDPVDPARVLCQPLRIVVRLFATRSLILPFLVAGCAGNPVRTLAPVPADRGSLECVRRALDQQGYDVRALPRKPNVLLAERREGQFATEVRRDLIQVSLETGGAAPVLGAEVWSVAYHPSASRPAAQDAVMTEPFPDTIDDARQVVRRCGLRVP